MMVGYYRQPGKTREVEWFSPDGLRYIRTGDTGRFDPDGFLILGDRKKRHADLRRFQYLS